MNRPRRLTGQQCLELLSQLAEDDSGGSGDEMDTDSNSESISPDQCVSSDSEGKSGSGTDSDTEAFEKDQVSTTQSNVQTAEADAGVQSSGRKVQNTDPSKLSLLAHSASRIVGRGRGRGRGKALSAAEPTVSVESGRDGTTWYSTRPGLSCSGRLAQHNILKEVPGPTQYARRRIKEGEVATAFHLLMDESMFRHIQNCTQNEARQRLQDNSWTVSMDELYAFVAILYARGSYGASKLDLKKLWDKTWGPSFFKDTMARDRFREIMRFLRFDVKSSRSQRLENDKFALASAVWNRFIDNCIQCYKPGTDITVDEQLFPTKARCRWTQYIASKPDKFGIKFWLASDVKSKYLVNGFPYLGRDESRPPGQRLGENVVLRLMEPYINTGRNVTTDNFFTSIKLAKDLKQRRTSVVGTMNRIRRELPASAKELSGELFSTRVFKHEEITLTVYKCKPTKNVLVLSSLHPTVAIGSNSKKKPETIEYYNNTKYGVDVLDAMAKKYTVKAGSRRWPIQVFYNCLDLAAINSWILYRAVTGKSIARRKFMELLAQELRDNYFASRDTSDNSADKAVNFNQMVTRKRRQCQVSKCKGNKTNEQCSVCQRAVCGTCAAESRKVVTCILCLKKL